MINFYRNSNRVHRANLPNSPDNYELYIHFIIYQLPVIIRRAVGPSFVFYPNRGVIQAVT